MARLRRVAVLVALALVIVGCGAQPVKPAATAQTPAPPVPTTAAPTLAVPTPAPPVPAQAAEPSAEVEPVPPTPAPPTRDPPPRPPLNLLRWRSALENYFLAVKPENQLPLEGARLPFAEYLHRVHARIHPIFAEQSLVSLDQLPSSHPLNRADRAQPFGPPPREIVSLDGLVYFHWELQRGQQACEAWNARPFLLRQSSSPP